MGGTGRLFGKTFFLQCQRRHPELPKIPTYLPRGWVPSGRALVDRDGGWCCLAPVPVPWFGACCARSPGLRHPAAVLAWHLSVCLGCGRRRASLACLVAPRGAPRLVRSGHSRCSGRLSRRRGAFPQPGGWGPRLYWAGARGTRRPAENRANCACRWPPPRQGRWARSALCPFRAPQWGCPWQVPPAPVLGCVRCGGWRVWTRSLTRPVSRTVHRSTADSAGAPGLFRVDADTWPCGSEDATPGSCACVRVLVFPGRARRAGLPGAFWCASPSPLAALSSHFAGPPQGWGCPCFGPLFALTSPVLLLFGYFFRLSVLFCLAPRLSLAFLGFGPRVPWALALCVVCFAGLALLGAPCALAFFVLPGRGPLSGGCPPPPSLAVVAVPRCLALVFFPLFFSSCPRPPCLRLFVFSGPGCPGPRRWFVSAVPGFPCSVFFFCLPPPGSSCALACFVSPGWPVVVPPWLLPPPPPLPFCVSRGSSFSLSAFVFFSPLLCAPVVSGFLCFAARGALGLGAVFCLFFSASHCPALRTLSPRVCLPPGRWLLPGGCRPPPSPFVSRGFRRSCSVPWFVFFFLCAPPLSPAFSGFRPWVPWASALCAVCFVGLPLLGSPCALASFKLSAWPLAAPWWLSPPPSLCVSRFSSLPLGAVCRVLCCAVCPWVRCCAALLRVVPPGVVLSCAVLLCCAGLVPLLVALCPLALPLALGPYALRCCVVRCSTALCALCCVCLVVAWLCVLLFAALLCTVCVPGCCAVRSLSSSLGAVLCFAVLVRLRCAVRLVRAVAGAWCCGALLSVVLFPLVCCGAVLGLVARGCLLVACFGVGVPVWPRGLLPCGWRGLLWCPASLCRFLWCCAGAWCCAVVLCCRVVVLLGLALPSCGLSCCAVLCFWLAVLFFARWWCLRAVVLFPSCCAFPVFSALCAAVPCCAGCGALLPCVVCCCAVLSCGAVLSCSAVVLRCCLCVFCPPVACRAAPCCAVLCCWLSVLFCARWWRLCAVVPFLSLPARTKNINYLTCHPALVVVSWLACLGDCGVLDLTRRTFHLQRKGGESVEGGARAGGEGTW